MKKNVCGGDIVSNSHVMHVMNQEKNIESIDAQELKERERQSKNIVIRGIKEESVETPTSLGKVIMVGPKINMYGVHRVRNRMLLVW